VSIRRRGILGHDIQLTALALAICLSAAACQAFWIELALPAVTPTPTVAPTATAPAWVGPTAAPSPTALPAPTGTPANRIDLIADRVQYWSNPNSINDVVYDGTTLWAATYGGLVEWTTEGEYVIHGMQDGLPSQAVEALAVDGLGRLWLSYADVDGYTVRTEGAWQHYATRREAVSAEYTALFNALQNSPRMFVSRPDSTWVWQPRTDGGVEAFDGSRWRVYDADNGVTPASRFVGISLDGRVWAVGQGIAYADEGELYWQDHTFFSEIESGEDVTDIAVDRQGTLWMTFAGVERGGLLRFDPADQRWEGHLPDINPAIPAGAHGIQIDPDGTLWVAGTGALSYHAPQRRFRTLALGTVTARCFVDGDSGEIWIGSTSGLWRLDPVSESIEGPWEVPSPLPDNRITGLALDAQGTVFVATPRGVSWIDESGATGLATAVRVSWLGTDATGQVWAASSDGIARLDANGLGAVAFPLEDIISAALAASGEIYLLTGDGKLILHDGRSARELADIRTWTGGESRALAADADGGVWVATGAGLAHLAADGAQELFTKDSGLLSNDVRGIDFDSEGNLWVATTFGLARHRPDGRWTRFTVESTGGGLRDLDMRDLSVGPTGDLWMATRAGLSRRQPAEADWSYVDLPGAQHVLHDGQDSLWVSTGAGLYRVPTTALTAVDSE
jgi:ligand-binding sensor domain-containing protein